MNRNDRGWNLPPRRLLRVSRSTLGLPDAVKHWSARTMASGTGIREVSVSRKNGQTALQFRSLKVARGSGFAEKLDEWIWRDLADAAWRHKLPSALPASAP